MANHAIDLLQAIQSATYANAAPLPLREQNKPEWQGLGFQIGGVRLVAPQGQVQELLKVPRVATLPGVQSWMLGIANVRGRLLPIVDLHDFLGVRPSLPPSQWRVMIVQDGDIHAGLIVEQSLGIQHFTSDSFEPVSDDLAEPLQPFVSGAFRHGGRVFYQFNFIQVLRDRKFNQVALSAT